MYKNRLTKLFFIFYNLFCIYRKLLYIYITTKQLLIMSKHTKGNWELSPLAAIVIENGYIPITVIDDDECIQICTVNTDKREPISRDEAIANAELIAEAGTVTNESGLTPRQLLEQRDELLEVAKRVRKWYETDGWPKLDPSTPVCFSELLSTINKAS